MVCRAGVCERVESLAAPVAVEVFTFMLAYDSVCLSVSVSAPVCLPGYLHVNLSANVIFFVGLFGRQPQWDIAETETRKPPHILQHTIEPGWFT